MEKFLQQHWYFGNFINKVLRELCHSTLSFVERTGNNFKLQISDFLRCNFIILLGFDHAPVNCRLTIKVHYGGNNDNTF